MSFPGHILYGAAANIVRTSDIAQFDEVVEYVREQYIAEGKGKEYREEISMPLRRRCSIIAFNTLRVQPGNQVVKTHALNRCISPPL